MKRSVLIPVLISGVASVAGAQDTALMSLSGSEAGSRFGRAMAFAGDVDLDGTIDLIVGAPQADLGGDRRGQALVFSGADHSLLHVFDGTADLHELGTAVAGAGDVDGDGHADLIVGEPWPYADSIVDAPGKAYVFSGADGSLLHTLTGTVVGDEFGAAVCAAGDVDGDGFDDVAVGAPDLYGGVTLDGRVAIFSGADGSLLHEVPLPTLGLEFGDALASYPDRDDDGVPELLIGAPRWVGPNPFSVGAVYLVSGADGAVLQLFEGVPYTSSNGPIAIGRTLGTLGDVDGDGVLDVWGGAHEHVRLWSGADGAVLRDHDSDTGSWDTPHAASLGDLDGDGRDEYLLCDPEASEVGSISGHAVARRGSDGALLGVQRGITNSGKLGSAVLVLGDADGDGRPEFLLGQPEHASQGPGQVLLYEYTPLVLLLSVEDGADPLLPNFGGELAAAGDVDNDGAVDVLVGEPGDSTAASNAGRLRVFSGRDGSLLHTLLGQFELDRLGWAVDAVGDLDRDGHDDFAAGLPFRKPPLAGAARIYSGATGAVLHELVGASAADRFGQSLAGVGDLDGDGVPDIAVGAPFDDGGAQDGGALRAFSGADGSSLFEVFGEAAFLTLGQAVAGGGDVNLDGVPDVLVGVPGANVGGGFPGSVRVLSGVDGSLLHLLAGPNPGSGFGVDPTSLAIVADLDGDLRDDILVGVQAVDQLRAYSGRTGALLWSVPSAQESGAGVASYVDFDGDGRHDVLAGRPGGSLVQDGEGELAVLSGADGSVLQLWPALQPGGNAGRWVDVLGDLDFDGLPEVLLAGDDLGNGDGFFLIWLAGDGSSPWHDLGERLPGAAGAPTLTPFGSLSEGSVSGVDVGSAAPSASFGLVVGLSSSSLPFKGGLLVPHPDVLVLGLTTDANGELPGLGGLWPAGIPAGLSTYYQVWVADAGGPLGYAATNAVEGVTQ